MRNWFNAFLILTLCGLPGLSESARADLEGSGQEVIPESDLDVPSGELLGSEMLERVSIFYFAQFNGPIVANPGSGLQALADGGTDPSHPIAVKNWMGLGYNLSDEITLTPTAYWLVQPTRDQKVAFLDPFLRLSHNSLIQSELFTLYADVRTHFPVSMTSRMNDLLFGVQTFQAVTWGVNVKQLWGQLLTSARYNYFGKQGFGNDLEFYAAPHLVYQVNSTFALSLLFEMGASHTFGERAFRLKSDGTDLQIGLNWDVTPSLTFNPYLTTFPTDVFTFQNSSLGATLSWSIM